MLGHPPSVGMGLNLLIDRISRISASLLAAQKHGHSQLFVWRKRIHLSKLYEDSGHGLGLNCSITP